jgi:hypothetical protein
LIYLKLNVEIYKGPFSISVYIQDNDDIKNLNDFWSENKIIQKYVNFHLVFKNEIEEEDNPISKIPFKSDLIYSYPINYLRNIARKNSKTNFILYLDIDFVLPINFKIFFKNDKILYYLNRLEQHLKAVIVLPAFNIQKLIVENENVILPGNKSHLLQLYNNKCKYLFLK